MDRLSELPQLPDARHVLLPLSRTGLAFLFSVLAERLGARLAHKRQAPKCVRLCLYRLMEFCSSLWRLPRTTADVGLGATSNGLIEDLMDGPRRPPVSSPRPPGVCRAGDHRDDVSPWCPPRTRPATSGRHPRLLDSAKTRQVPNTESSRFPPRQRTGRPRPAHTRQGSRRRKTSRPSGSEPTSPHESKFDLVENDHYRNSYRWRPRVDR